MIDAVLLDAGGVFVMPSHRVVADVAAAHGGGRPEADALVRGHYEGVAAGEGPDGFAWRLYRRALLDACGVPGAAMAGAEAALRLALDGPADQVWVEPLPGAVAGFRALEGLGLPLAVVSNSDGTVASALGALGVGPPGPGLPLRAILDSAVVGVAKPDPSIFELALAAVGTDPARTVHVGDTLSSDVIGAVAAGVRPLHLDPVGWCASPDHEHVTSLAAVARLVTTERG